MANQTCNPQLVTQALGIQATGPRTVIVPADPIIWDEGTSYEYLTLVASTDFGQGYVSKRDVPAGTELTNTEYWIPVASYNAQLANINKQLAEVQSTVADAVSSIDELTESTAPAIALSKVSGIDAGVVNAMLDCASTYFDAVRNKKLTYGDGIMANQANGTMSCSSFVWAILHGIPYSDYVFASSVTTTRSNYMHRYGYHMLCDMNNNPVTLTAQGTYDYFEGLGMARPVESADDVNVGDIVFIGDSIDTINHCSIVIGFTFNKSTAFVIESSGSTEGPAPISAGPRCNGIGFSSIMGVARPPLTSVSHAATPLPVSINLDSGKVSITDSSRASLCAFVTIDYEAEQNASVTITLDNGSSPVADYTFVNGNEGRGSILLVDYYGSYVNVSGVKWFDARACLGYGSSDEVYIVGSEANVVNYMKGSGTVPKVAFINSAANITPNLPYTMLGNNRDKFSSNKKVLAVAENAASLHVGSIDLNTDSTFSAVTSIYKS